MINREKRMTDTLGYFNFARGIGIIFVVFGHTLKFFVSSEISDQVFGNALVSIGSAVMAMFFMVSGFGFRSKKIKKAILEQANMLLLPYAVTAGLILAAKLTLSILKHRSFMEYGGENVIAYLLALNKGYEGTILGMPVSNIAMMWFFWALFGGWNIYNAITRMDDVKKQYALVGFCVVLSFPMVYFSKVWPFVLPHMLQAVGFICVGKLVRDTDFLEKKQNPLVYIAIAVPAMITLAFGGVDIYTCMWKLSIIDYVGILCLGVLILKMFSMIQNMQFKSKIYGMISLLGINTLEILCIHAFDEKVIPWYNWLHFFTGREWLGVIVYAFVRTCFIFVAFKLVKFIQHKFFKKKKKKHKKIKLQIDQEEE